MLPDIALCITHTNRGFARLVSVSTEYGIPLHTMQISQVSVI